MDEPRLTDKDRRIFNRWRQTCKRWADSRAHQRLVFRAKAVCEEMYDRRPEAYVAWSGGKDSTALAHLVCQNLGLGAHCMSVCDDLDYPGEVEYLTRLADRWGCRVDIVEPDFSLQEWIDEHSEELEALPDLHSRASEFARRAFYEPIEQYRKAHDTPGVYLGLRSEESAGRLANRKAHGLIYEKQNGEAVAQPLADWSDRDVYAYLFDHDVPLLDVYQCVRLHDSPADVRKSWWLPHSGSGADFEGLTWLKTYWPSLYQRLCDILPEANHHA